MDNRNGQTKQCIVRSVPPGTSKAKPGHFGVPKTTFGISGQYPKPGLSRKNRDGWSASLDDLELL